MRMPTDTCFIQHRSFPIPPSASHVAGPGSRLEPTIDGSDLVLRRSETGGAPVQDGNVFIPETVLEALGWKPGTVVEIHSEATEIRVVKSRDPLSASYVTHHRGAAVPPGWLAQTVVGTPNVEKFVQSSYELARTIVSAADRHIGDRGKWRVLDFGCGCGRLSRALPLYHECEIVGCDLQPAAIEWCRRWLDGEYFVGREAPPLDRPDSSFDLLVAISVLTHLSEEHQDAWLAEWSRLMRPGGILFVTFRGRSYVGEVFVELFPAQRRRELEDQWAQTGGIAHARSDFWDGVFPEYYGDTFHTEEYVRSRWGQFFEVLEIVPASRSGVVTQDTAVLRATG
jgi:SAM-dependent methyltransferase